MYMYTLGLLMSSPAHPTDPESCERSPTRIINFPNGGSAESPGVKPGLQRVCKQWQSPRAQALPQHVLHGVPRSLCVRAAHEPLFFYIQAAPTADWAASAIAARNAG